MKSIPDREKIPGWYKDGQSVGEIAAKVGLTKGAVQSILRARGVQLRTGQQAYAVKYPTGRRGAKAANWRGGRRYVKHGKKGEQDDTYIYIFMPEHPHATKAGYVMEHRLVVEKRIGRILTPAEVVHHLDGVKTNNSEENLELVDSRGNHVRLHFDAVKEVARLKAIIKQYEARYGPL